ncbi:forkhead box protein N1 [Scleropages formosus]|uniref:forkhead box protein N1 n=1 Tax=Scleropages formosus TaxID=113540 RepID=UPI00087893E7|nr:forkhead box protein N1 [Scleropages formosus]
MEKYRRHSADEVMAGQQLLRGPGRFHPYHRQYSGGGLPCEPPACPRTLDLFQGVGIREAPPVAQPYQDPTDNGNPWGPPLGCILQTPRTMGSERDFLGVPEETPCYPEQIHSTYGSLPPLEPSRLTEAQFPTDVYSPDPASSGSQYTYHCVTPQGPSNSTVHSGYPKPIYSYSILIFMALRSSKTGSLPVSEIYSFMTENFPYFKTAPDGWKNSVRHNLSLNKCFEKVENKNGNASRKGCLWALNPAKVEKMQEELHKWRRKDPLTVRKSMARPEELDRLLGDRPGKWKPLQGQPAHPHGHTHAPCFGPPQSPVGSHALQQNQRSPSSQPLLQLLPSSFPYCYPNGQRHISAMPPGTADLESPRLVHDHPGYGAALQASHCAPKGMQELLLEGDLCNDVDTLNPSLTDLQLHGHLWEELKDDSLTPDSLVVIASSPSLPGHCVKGEVSVGSITDEKGTPSNLHFTGLYSAAFASMDSVAGCVPVTGNTPIPLL